MRRAIKPVQRTCARQQRQVDAFQQEYHTEGQHEALQQETPTSHQLKEVTTSGTFRFDTTLLDLVTPSSTTNWSWENEDGNRAI